MVVYPIQRRDKKAIRPEKTDRVKAVFYYGQTLESLLESVPVLGVVVSVVSSGP